MTLGIYCDGETLTRKENAKENLKLLQKAKVECSIDKTNIRSFFILVRLNWFKKFMLFMIYTEM